jgi:hypothetical protein
MDGLYSATWLYFLTMVLCVLPAIVGAVFGRGAFMVAAAFFSALAFLSIFPVGFITWVWPRVAAKGSFWAGLMVPIGLAGLCACVAIVEERRKRSRPSN